MILNLSLYLVGVLWAVHLGGSGLRFQLPQPLPYMPAEGEPSCLHRFREVALADLYHQHDGTLAGGRVALVGGDDLQMRQLRQ